MLPIRTILRHKHLGVQSVPLNLNSSLPFETKIHLLRVQGRPENDKSAPHKKNVESNLSGGHEMSGCGYRVYLTPSKRFPSPPLRILLLRDNVSFS